MRLDTLRDDLRYAVRSLLKNPGFALVAVLTLAVGVGANTAIFSVLHAVVLRDLPYRDADRLVVLWTLKLGQNSRHGSSYLNVRDWRDQSRSFEDIAVYYRPMVTRATLTGGDEPERVYRGMVGPGLFQVLGAPALLGRTLETPDSEAGSRAVVIGVRMALGASYGSVLRMVLASGLRLAGAGLALGLLGSIALGRTIAGFLYETSPFDPLVYGGVVAILIGVTALACVAPARRAARVDPIVALRSE
jgi:hypothetical protein